MRKTPISVHEISSLSLFQLLPHFVESGNIVEIIFSMKGGDER